MAEAGLVQAFEKFVAHHTVADNDDLHGSLSCVDDAQRPAWAWLRDVYRGVVPSVPAARGSALSIRR
jgi:hypothetical protein